MDPKDLQQELDRIKQHLQSLQAMVQIFESKLKPPNPSPPPPPATPYIPTGIPVAQPHPTAPLTRKKESSSIETTLGVRWMVVTGVIALIIALGFELRLAIAKGWLTQPVRCALAGVLGLGFFVGGSGLRRKYPRYGEVLMSGGVVAVFLGIYAAHSLYHLIDGVTALFSLLGVAWSSALFSWKARAKAPIYIGLLGCYLAPFLVDTLGNSATSIFIFLAILNSSYVLISLVIEDVALQILALYLATAVYALAWYVRFHEPVEQWHAAFYYQLFQALAFSFAAASGALFRGEGLSKERTWFLLPAVLLFYYLGGDLLLRHAPLWHAAFGIGAASLVFGVAQIGRVRLQENLAEHTPSVMASLVALIVGYHLLLENFDGVARSTVMFVWFYTSVAVWLGFKRATALGIFIVLQGAWLAVTLHFNFGYSPDAHLLSFINLQCVLLSIFSASLLVFPRREDSPELASFLDLIGHSLMLHTLYLQFTLNKPSSSGSLYVTLVWILYAGMILALGFFRQSQRLRSAALWIFALCTFKVFLYDTLASSMAIKVQSYLFLGVALIVGGYYYQRLKADGE